MVRGKGAGLKPIRSSCVSDDETGNMLITIYMADDIGDLTNLAYQNYKIINYDKI